MNLPAELELETIQETELETANILQNTEDTQEKVCQYLHLNCIHNAVWFNNIQKAE